MEIIINYVKPELMVLVPVLWFIGKLLKESKLRDEYIPLTLTAFSLVLSVLFILATSTLANSKDVAMALFTAITQGFICVGLAVYGNQLIKQGQKLGGGSDE